MSISKTVVRLSAAALVVAGGVGMVWAQVSGGTSQDNASMRAGMTIKNIAEIDVIPKNPTDKELVLEGLATINDVPTATKFGSLGIVKVTTNSNKWDVAMTTRSGGRLLDTTSVQCRDVERVDGWGNPTGIFDEVCGGTAVYLQAGGSDVVLQVAVGLAKSGKALGNTGAPATLYPIISGTPLNTPAFIAPVVINQSKIIGSDKSAVTPPALPTAVSFAEELGGAAAGTWGMFQYGIYGSGSVTGTTPDTWGKIATDGFPAPKGNAEPQDEYFYVNVGMPEATYNSLSGNKNGTFTEVFYFDLFANF